MKHTYTITGMTCDGCKNSVEKSLKDLEGITDASVDLEKAEAKVKMSHYIPLETLQKAISSKYKIEEKQERNVFQSSSNNNVEETSDLKLLNYNPWDSSNFMLDFMGLFYVVFSFFKFLDLKGFPESFRMYDPLAKVMPVYGWIYPFIELALGLFFLMRIEIPIALFVTLVILGITTIGVTKTLLDKKSIQCACLGTALKLPMTKATFIENSIMIIMAIIMLLKL